SQLVERLLDLSQLRVGRLVLAPRPSDLVAVVRDGIDSVSRPVGARIAIDAPDSLPAQVDPVRLEQVVANLVDNAFRHGPKDGPVEVAVHAVGEDRAEITVSDRGEGIPPSDRDRIFERLYRAPGRSGTGLGLGLHVSREIVTLHGGTLTVEAADTATG